MRFKFCLLIFFCAAAVTLVRCETTIEVDENGDEYEVKRFNIESRQLGEERSQCVVTRRKRATSTSGDKMPTRQTSMKGKPEEDLTTSATTPPSGVDTNTEVDEENNNENSGLSNDSEGLEPEEADNFDDDYDSLPLNQEDNESFPASLQKNGFSAPIVPNEPAQVTDENGIVVVQSDEPPKVNPQTHAVFELLPVNNAINAAVAHDEGDDSEVHYEEEISPVSTTAIWSTGDDNGPIDDLYDDYDYDVDKVRPNKNKKKNKNKTPQRGGSKKKKNKKNKKKKGTKRPKPSRRPLTTKKPKKPTTKQPKKHRRPGDKNRRPMQGNRRRTTLKPFNQPHRLPVNANGMRVGAQQRPMVVRNGNNKNQSIRGNNNRKNLNQNKKRLAHANSSNVNKNRRKLNNGENHNRGTKTFTKTETVTQTGTADEDKDVNCIIIRKDPPTTARPFWNVFGRDAGAVESSGQFGKRKRANLRFVTKN